MTIVTSIDQVVAGIVSFFVAILGIRIFLPIMMMIFGKTWNNGLALTILKLAFFMVIFVIVYFLVYGKLLNKKKKAEEGSY